MSCRDATAYGDGFVTVTLSRWGIFRWPQLGEFGWPSGLSGRGIYVVTRAVPVRICAGGAEKSAFLPRPVNEPAHGNSPRYNLS